MKRSLIIVLSAYGVVVLTAVAFVIFVASVL